MTDFHHRKSIRFAGYDYSAAGVYFVTIVTWNREPIFGQIIDQEMVLNACGQIAYAEWAKTPSIRPNVTLGAFQIMPNHLHGILIFTESNLLPNNTGAHCCAPLHPDVLVGAHSSAPRPTAPDMMDSNVESPSEGAHCRAPLRNASLQNASGAQLCRPARSLGSCIAQIKSIPTRQINQLRQTPDQPVWQRNYHERIIRDERDWGRIDQYIRANPANWNQDEENPYP